ncbi:sensor histidine kinase [Paenibacillus sp. GSMTC-2017]|uniref:sensor histidine kinase n=1 Tax=Paenibacillus sp. GSMTC-2017 TaxID=2794350 RepID=UPI0018D84327|nr:histidine kinase [Paenibacillus sp. GSMTC-2017]MBH5317347.1 sensor histidine kinase [Paenibacillus sp. GSMTC-2017]
MSYKWLKWLILWIPTIVIGLWEYARHAFLLPYVSMELGNLLAPIFVFLITLTLVRSLFAKLEVMQESLKRQQVVKAAFEEREQLARELHDGISQSLFMLSVKLDKLDRSELDEDASRTMEGIRHTVRHVYDDVRQSLANLQSSPLPSDSTWLQSIHKFISDMEQGSDIQATVDSRLHEGLLTHKQKIELLAIIREALMNVQKHADASRVLIHAEHVGSLNVPSPSFVCTIVDDGKGIELEKLQAQGKYGVKMMSERAKAMGWHLLLLPGDQGGVKVEIKGG